MGDWIYASIGKNTSMEFFQTWQKEEKALEDLKAVTRAVIDGNFSEDIWSLDGKIVKSSGVFEIDGKKRRAGSSRLFFNPFRRTERQHFDYEPYSQDNG